MPTFVPRGDPRPDDAPWPQFVWPDPTRRLANDHVELTRSVAGDAPELAVALTDPSIWQYVPHAPSTEAQWRRQIAASDTGGRVMWTVRDRSGGVVGTTSYLDIVPGDARLEIGSTSYHPGVWGTAVNPSCKLLLLGHAFEELHAGRVQLKTDIRNERSQRAIARLGAQYEGTLMRYQRRNDGSVRDTVLFAITAELWPGVRTGLSQRLAHL